MLIENYLNQDYDFLKKINLESNTLYCDEKFDATKNSLFLIKPPKIKEIVWKRPHEITDNPQFIIDGINSGDLDQGKIGNCWFITAISNITSIENYCKFIIPNSSQQTFKDEDYAGIFKFRFWRFGKWYQVVVDDLLPVDKSNNMLVYCRNRTMPNEFYGPLLEKAYAKLASCYEFLIGGDSTTAMVDLTGAVREKFYLKNCLLLNNKTDSSTRINSEIVDKETLWAYLINAYKMESLMVCSTYNSEFMYSNSKNGLVAKHAYSIKQVVELYGKTIRLLKLRNPWGKKPWTGPWSNKSSEWTNLSDMFKQENNLYLEQNEGEFYITLNDLVINFKKLSIVHVNLNAFYNIDINKTNYLWQLKQFYGSFNLVFDLNQDDQYLLNQPLSLTENNERSILIISLMQPYSAKLRMQNNGKQAYFPIKFDIYNVVINNEFIEQKNKYSLNDNRELMLVDSSGDFSEQREVTKRFSLRPKQKIVIIPRIFSNCQIVECNYLLRLYSNNQSCSYLTKLLN